MALITPTPLQAVAIDPAQLGFATIGTVQPFSPRTGIGYQDLLETLRHYITEDVYNALIALADPTVFNENVAALVDAINTALTTQQSNVAKNLADTLTAITQGAYTALNDSAVLNALKLAASTSQAYLDTRYRRPISYADVPTSGIWSAHQSGGAVPYSTTPVESILAMRSAVANGATYLDIDVRQTYDGVLVIHHDADTTITSPGVNTTVEAEQFNQLPLIDFRGRVGTGWAPEPMPTLRQVFAEFGGSVIITIELKGGSQLLPAVAALVHQFHLEQSVFINYDVAGYAFAASVQAAGLLSHMYNLNTVTDVQNAISNNAKLIEIPYNASADLVTAALGISANNGRVIAGPINGRDQRTAMDSRIQGYVSDAPGYLKVPYGVPIANGIGGAIRSGRQGVGWIARNPYSLTDPINWLTAANGMIVFDGASNNVQFRDLAGNRGTNYSFTFKAKFLTLPTATTQYIGVRGLCTNDVPASNPASDPAHKGYVFALRANGSLAVFEVNPSTSASTLIGSTTGDTVCVAGTTYSVKVDVTPTTITATRLDSNKTTGALATTTWRGGYFHSLTSMTDGKGSLMDLAFG